MKGPMKSILVGVVFVLLVHFGTAAASSRAELMALEVASLSLPDSYTATVDSTGDAFPANASYCAPDASTGQCSLRSALLLCAEHLIVASRECIVQLPVAATLAVNTSQGELELTASNAAGSLLIVGEGCQISPLVDSGEGTNTGRLFNIKGSEGNSLSFHLSNVTIARFGSSTTTGGAVALQNLVSGSMIDVGFHNNAGDSGGGLYVEKCPGFHFFRCLFEHNNAVNDGGGVLIDTFSSGIQFESCLFVDNRVELGLGGGMFIRDNNNDIVLQQCNFTRNIAVRGAGLNVNNYNYRMNLTDLIFLNNSASDRGGGLSISSFNYFFLMDKCLLENNFAVEKYGGAFYIYADNWYITVQHSEFIGNVAGLYGGAIDLYSNNDHVVFTNSKFVRNVGMHGGAGVDSYTDNDDMSFYHCDFIENVAHIEGGGLFIGTSNDRYILDNCIFWGNSAGSYGGAVLLIRENYQLHLTNCSFRESVSGSAGGAVHSSLLNSQMVFESCEFFQCSTRSYGGAIYFGEDHSDIIFSNANFSFNIADTGGALYISKFNTQISFENTHFTHNLALYTGGALVSLASDMNIRDCHFAHNQASSAGAIHSVSGTYGSQGFVNLHNNSFLSNQANDLYGAVFMEFCKNCQIASNRFERNSAMGGLGLGGALAIYNSFQAVIADTLFVENSVGQTAGALYLLRVESVAIVKVILELNAAYLGGAIYVEESTNVSLVKTGVWNNTAGLNAGGVGAYDSSMTLRGNEFLSNKAVTGSGSALHVMASALSLENNYFADNWSGQAGTVFWDYFSGMTEPVGLNSSSAGNTFAASNVAVYGPQVATQGVELILNQNNSYQIVDYTLPVPPISMVLSDYYQQTVLTESNAIVQVTELPSYCYGLDPYITGGITERFRSGVATFSTMAAFCAAGYNLTISFSSSLVRQNVGAVLAFRDCVRGEYFSDRVCTSCPQGTYSLVDPNTLSLTDLTYALCESCPDSSIAETCSGDEIVLKEGHWRISTSSDFISECPKDSPSCLGGNVAGDESCGVGYHGPLCAICDDDYFFSSSSNTCETCTTASSLQDPIFLTILILSVLATSVSGYLMFQKIKKAKVQTMDDLVIYLFFNSKRGRSDDPVADKKRAVNQSRSLRGHLKIYITYFQILAALPHILEIDFPTSFTKVMSAASFLNLEIMQSSVVSCSSTSSPDHISVLYVETTYPFVFGFVIYCCANLHIYTASRRSVVSRSVLMKIQSTYVAILLTFTYLILPHITAHILSTFNCIDVDEDDVVEGNDEYLAMDLSVSCSDDRYRFAVLWAALSILVYPIGMPACYFYLLYTHREDIINRDTPLPSAEEEEERSLRIRPLRLLYDFYKPEFWYWEPIETLLRLSVSGFLVLFGPGSSLQVTMALLLALIYVNLYIKFNTFFTESLQKTKIATLWQLYFVFFFAFVIKANFIDSEEIFVAIAFMVLIFASCVKNFMDFSVDQSGRINEFRQVVGTKVRQMSRSSREVELDKLFADVRQSKEYK